MMDPAVYARRRAELMERIGPHGVAVFHSPPESVRNSDVQFPFRQSSDMIYLTGFLEPGSALVLRPGADNARYTLFVRPRDPEQETWHGRRAGVDGARQQFGADQAYPISELEEQLPDLLANTDDLYYSLGENSAFDARIAQTIAGLRRAERRGKRAPVRVIDPRSALHEMRLIKQPAELAALRRAAEITVGAHREAMKLAAPGRGEHEIEAAIGYAFRRSGGVGPGYPSIIAGGVNATILHYTENNCPLADGDLLLIDAGCEYGYYTADVTRTFPINGRFSPAQRRLYDIVLRAQREAIAMARPGATIDAIHQHTLNVLTAGLIDLGVIDGPVEARIADEGFKPYYMHRTSHWLGMDVHDVGDYTRSGQSRPLEPGMVITVEPGLYVNEAADERAAAYRGIGIRIEDDILITADGHENLTAAAPTSIDEVEAACVGP